MHYAANLERARSHYRQERRTINHQGPGHTQVVVAVSSDIRNWSSGDTKSGPPCGA